MIFAELVDGPSGDGVPNEREQRFWRRVDKSGGPGARVLAVSLPDGLLALCLDVYEERMEMDGHIPLAERQRLARAAAERVAVSRAPGAVAHIERSRGQTGYDETKLPRLRKLAAPTIGAVAQEASAATGGDVTPELLTGPASYPWLAQWRGLAWWRLSREGMRMRGIALTFGRSVSTVHEGIRNHDARTRVAEMRANVRAIK